MYIIYDRENKLFIRGFIPLGEVFYTNDIFEADRFPTVEEVRETIQFYKSLVGDKRKIDLSISIITATSTFIEP